jgi:uncharacterized protein (TIGR03435 family)
MKLVLLAAASLAASAQTPPTFEVATVKPSDPTAVMSIRRSGHRIVTTGTPLEFLIKWAFDLQTDRIVGRPPWLDSDRFDVVGASPLDEQDPPTKPGEPTLFQRRMQTLLADRFGLKTHRETREMAIYAVSVAKGGFKPPLAPEPDVFGQQPFQSAGLGRLVGTQVTVWMLAKVLSDPLGRTAQDQTGLRGVFDFKLDWAPDGVTDGRPSLFTALEEQLGLKLEARRGPVEVLVIDHVERAPKGN